MKRSLCYSPSKKDGFSNVVGTITAFIFQDVQLSKNRTSVFFYLKFGLWK